MSLYCTPLEIKEQSRKDSVKELFQRHLQGNGARLLTGQEVTSASKCLDQERLGKERNLDQL
jgi:hypothetical protein